MALKNFTDYEVRYIHVTHGARIDIDFNDYDVLFHNYCARLCYEGYVSADYERAVAGFRGLKIVAVQDDYEHITTFYRAVRRMGFHILITCIQRDFWPLVYPVSELPDVTIVQGLTGYMPERIAGMRSTVIPLSERKTLVAYRARALGARYGRLGFEKYEIGRRMIEECRARKIPYNIAMDESSRLYGDAWFDFLGFSRTMLGTESGSNTFDFDGSLDKRIKEFNQREGRAPTYPEFKHILDPIEAPFNVGQISPRIFETAVMRTPMINFRGNYSGVIQPDAHYIALEKDFSNIDSVFAKLHDLDLLEGIAARAYDKLVKSGDYGYRSLARLISDAIEVEYLKRVDLSEVRPPPRPSPKTERPLSETPTETPLPPDELIARLAESSRAKSELAELAGCV